MDRYLAYTPALDWNTPEVREKAIELTSGLEEDKEKAIALFYFVRDEIRYRITQELPALGTLKASITLKRGYGFCIPKAVLLTSFARSVGIPTRLHFADVRNHRLPKDLKQTVGSALLPEPSKKAIVLA